MVLLHRHMGTTATFVIKAALESALDSKKSNSLLLSTKPE